MPSQLTPREEDVLMLVVQGLTNKAIAQKLQISVHTVESHLHHIYMKIDAESRSQAVAWYVRTVEQARKEDKND